jgi:hypothetical protein
MKKTGSRISDVVFSHDKKSFSIGIGRSQSTQGIRAGEYCDLERERPARLRSRDGDVEER